MSTSNMVVLDARIVVTIVQNVQKQSQTIVQTVREGVTQSSSVHVQRSASGADHLAIWLQTVRFLLGATTVNRKGTCLLSVLFLQNVLTVRKKVTRSGTVLFQ